MLSHMKHIVLQDMRTNSPNKKKSFTENLECCIDKKERIMCKWHPHLFYFCTDMVPDTFSTL